ncbi:MAG: DMT family transporter, partial [Chloroflexota bacterium]
AASYGVAMVYSRINLRGLPPLVAPTASLTFAAVYLIPVTLLFDQPFALSTPSFSAIGALLILAIFGTAIAFVVFYHAIEQTSATNVSMVTYLIPIFGIVLGIAVLSETLHWTAYAGCALILLGVMVVNGVFKAWMMRLRPEPVGAASS